MARGEAELKKLNINLKYNKMIHLKAKFNENSEHEFVWIEMGNGDVGMHISDFDKKVKSVMIAFKDGGVEMPIGKLYNGKDFYNSFIEMNPPVIITFSNPKSIDSMISQLKDMKKILKLGIPKSSNNSNRKP